MHRHMHACLCMCVCVRVCVFNAVFSEELVAKGVVDRDRARVAGLRFAGLDALLAITAFRMGTKREPKWDVRKLPPIRKAPWGGPLGKLRAGASVGWGSKLSGASTTWLTPVHAGPASVHTAMVAYACAPVMQM